MLPRLVVDLNQAAISVASSLVLDTSLIQVNAAELGGPRLPGCSSPAGGMNDARAIAGDWLFGRRARLCGLLARRACPVRIVGGAADHVAE